MSLIPRIYCNQVPAVVSPAKIRNLQGLQKFITSYGPTRDSWFSLNVILQYKACISLVDAVVSRGILHCELKKGILYGSLDTHIWLVNFISLSFTSKYLTLAQNLKPDSSFSLDSLKISIARQISLRLSKTGCNRLSRRADTSPCCLTSHWGTIAHQLRRVWQNCRGRPWPTDGFCLN